TLRALCRGRAAARSSRSISQPAAARRSRWPHASAYRPRPRCRHSKPSDGRRDSSCSGDHPRAARRASTWAAAGSGAGRASWARGALGARLLSAAPRERAPVERRGEVMRKVAAAAAMLIGTTASALLARETAAPVAYVVMDADSGTILAEHDAHKRWPPASMAK